jgi:hypothetical protein
MNIFEKIMYNLVRLFGPTPVKKPATTPSKPVAPAAPAATKPAEPTKPASAESVKPAEPVKTASAEPVKAAAKPAAPRKGGKFTKKPDA